MRHATPKWVVIESSRGTLTPTPQANPVERKWNWVVLSETNIPCL